MQCLCRADRAGDAQRGNTSIQELACSQIYYSLTFIASKPCDRLNSNGSRGCCLKSKRSDSIHQIVSLFGFSLHAPWHLSPLQTQCTWRQLLEATVVCFQGFLSFYFSVNGLLLMHQMIFSAIIKAPQNKPETPTLINRLCGAC